MKGTMRVALILAFTLIAALLLVVRHERSLSPQARVHRMARLADAIVGLLPPPSPLIVCNPRVITHDLAPWRAMVRLDPDRCPGASVFCAPGFSRRHVLHHHVTNSHFKSYIGTKCVRVIVPVERVDA